MKYEKPYISYILSDDMQKLILTFPLKHHDENIEIHYDAQALRWYGDKLTNNNEVVKLSESEVAHLVEWIKLRPFIYADDDIIEFLDYCYQNEFYNYQLRFLFINEDGFNIIDCCNSDWFCECFSTFSKSITWLFDLSGDKFVTQQK